MLFGNGTEITPHRKRTDYSDLEPDQYEEQYEDLSGEAKIFGPGQTPEQENQFGPGARTGIKGLLNDYLFEKENGEVTDNPEEVDDLKDPEAFEQQRAEQKQAPVEEAETETGPASQGPESEQERETEEVDGLSFPWYLFEGDTVAGEGEQQIREYAISQMRREYGLSAREAHRELRKKLEDGIDDKIRHNETKQRMRRNLHHTVERVYSFRGGVKAGAQLEGDALFDRLHDVLKDKTDASTNVWSDPIKNREQEQETVQDIVRNLRELGLAESTIREKIQQRAEDDQEVSTEDAAITRSLNSALNDVPNDVAWNSRRVSHDMDEKEDEQKADDQNAGDGQNTQEKEKGDIERPPTLSDREFQPEDLSGFDIMLMDGIDEQKLDHELERELLHRTARAYVAHPDRNIRGKEPVTEEDIHFKLQQTIDKIQEQGNREALGYRTHEEILREHIDSTELESEMIGFTQDNIHGTVADSEQRRRRQKQQNGVEQTA